MTGHRYPKDAEARETFSDEDFTVAVDAKMVSEQFTVASLSQSKLRDGITIPLTHAFAEMAECIPGAIIATGFDGLEIRRNITRGEAETLVLQDRKSEMWYSEDSPHFIPRSERD